jgi:deoxyinosine 3'endonuclease (endonuclease V)
MTVLQLVSPYSANLSKQGLRGAAGDCNAQQAQGRRTPRPLFVSVGHNLDLRSAVALVLRCATRHRLPEPTRLADRLVARAKRETAR